MVVGVGVGHAGGGRGGGGGGAGSAALGLWRLWLWRGRPQALGQVDDLALDVGQRLNDVAQGLQDGIVRKLCNRYNSEILNTQEIKGTLFNWRK